MIEALQDEACQESVTHGDQRAWQDRKKPRTALTKQIGGNHYSKMAIQPVEFIERNNLTFLQGNVIKYTCRHADKNGKQDLLKAIHYLELMIELHYPETPVT